MFDDYVALVQSADAAKRREAIISFGKLGDPRALKYLAQVYKTDSDPALRELAAKAGRHIQKLQQGGASSQPGAAQPLQAPTPAPQPPSPAAATPGNIPDILAAYTRPGRMAVRGAGEATPPPTTDDDDPLAGIGDEPPTPLGNMPSILAGYTTPGAAPTAGAGLVAAPSAVGGGQSTPPRAESAAPAASADKADKPEQAAPIEKSASPQNKERAARDLRTAYAYKTRSDDTNAIAFLAKAFRLDPEMRGELAAINLAVALVGGTGKEAVNTILQKSGKPETAKPKAKSFDPELIDVLIAMLILFVIVGLFNVAFTYGTLIVAQALVPMLFSGMPPEYSAAGLQALFNGMTLQSLLPEILKGSFVTIISTFFQTMIVYMTGNMMGGAGNFLRFARVMINIQIIFYVLIALSFGAMIAGLASDSIPTFKTLMQVGALGLAITVVGTLFVQGWLAGRVQEFGFWKGLASVIVGSILAGIIAGALGMFNTSTPEPGLFVPPELDVPTPSLELGI